MKGRRLGRLACVGHFGLMLVLSGCGSFSPDGGMSTVQAIATTELGKEVGRILSDADAAEVDARMKALLRGTLSIDNAVQIALLNNRGLQAAFAELAAAEAESVQASLPPSPTISLARLTATRELEIERQIIINVLG